MTVEAFLAITSLTGAQDNIKQDLMHATEVKEKTSQS